MTFGDYIKRRLKELGKTQRAAAAAMGVSYTYFADVANGRIKRPGAEFCRKLADVLEVSPVEVLRAAGWLPPEDDEGTLVEDLRYLARDPLFLDLVRVYRTLSPTAQRLVVALLQVAAAVPDDNDTEVFRYAGNVYVKPVGRGIVLDEEEGEPFLETAIPPGSYEAVIVLRRREPTDESKMPVPARR